MIRKKEAWRGTCFPEWGVGGEKDCAKQAEGFANAEFGNSNVWYPNSSIEPTQSP